MREQLERAEARARQAEELLPDAAELQVANEGLSLGRVVQVPISCLRAESWVL